ncbi:coiled-coil domain-containing protein 134 isoform X2 [Nilaparvata lugens]|uniref:coiled-coil domain-containing protein 134 isoform X2 n=1 Tax=Nilaparvata lugens TaxID=108931 RepID=UPI000B982CA3|nr:coiled-coil domain-containing protein 134 isoform X2 [Nilaparvata lugens]
MNLVIWLLLIVAPIVTFQSIATNRKTLFRNLFRMRRSEQTIALKTIKKIDNEPKQKKMISAVLDKIFDMVMKNKDTIVKSEFVPGISPFPGIDDEEVRDALFTLMTNTAFVGDILLQLPELSQPILNSQKEWSSLLQWSIEFANKTNLLDEPTSKLMKLVGQEMNYTVRSENYLNPFKKQKSTTEKPIAFGSEQKKKKKKVKSIPRGPRLSPNFEL